jgi:sodium/hydrogen antiporter
MNSTAVLLTLAMVFVWGAISVRLERAHLTAPIVFTAAGACLAGLDLVDAHSAPDTFKPLVEVTLVWVLFSDAARVKAQDLRDDVGCYVRLLGVGLPLAVLGGWGLAAWLFPDLGGWLALLVAAALAPTDAALGVPVVTNPAVPSRVRRLITVESGLNDGIVTPVVMVAIAGAAAAEGLHDASGSGKALEELAIGLAIGVLVGGVGGWLLHLTRHRGWVAQDFAGIAVLSLALAAYMLAIVAHANGFIAAFCGGLAFGAMAGRRGRTELVFLEQASGAVSFLVWLAFGAIAVPLVLDGISLSVVLYAVLSLTVVRMVPVALATIGAGLGLRTVLFVGWFGPRGLASLVFALLAVEELGKGTADPALVLIAITVFLSVLAHGVSAAPLANWYARNASPGEPGPPGPRTEPLTGGGPASPMP